MFRIESYITPIILSHIDKYVKDFRPKDAQVSLWGGEVAFQNLDLRLDVLEEELQLPFNFVSGHIHELTVRVPWTKIASEPIQITINTIEFVLKLKTNDTTTNVPKKEKKKTEVVQAPPGYMASLVNKIANNISIKLHNIILKYVEEDIVVSMNIQLLSFDSADEDWNPAFIDISPTKVLLKKVINISDLTICLDKRNALGKIDICQEPILYRCTLQTRMLRKYNISSAHRSSLTRIDIFTDSIELNVSAQQYPMLQRLIVLAMTLRDGTMRKVVNPNPANPEATADDDTDEGNEDSMIAWAWNLLPSIFPTEFDEDDDEEKGHYLHTGMYIDNLKITYKSQEISTDFIAHSTKKIKYHPILRISLMGIYMDSVTLGQRWFNMKGGISYIGVYPMGMCTCGKKNNQTRIFNSADILCDHKAYLNDSLKDEECPENNDQFRSYDRLWESHLSKVSEDFLLKRTPAIAFDVIHQVEIPDDVARSSNLGSDLEYSNLSESYLCRAIVGSFNFKYGSSLVHIIETLKDYSDSYDYAPYAQEKLPLTLSQLSPPSTEDFEALMADIPIKMYQLSIYKPVLEYHVGDHDILKIKYNKRPRPYIGLELDRANFQMIEPIYPNRLVHTTCQLPNPPSKLINSCYTKMTVNCKNVVVKLCVGLIKQNHFQFFNIDSSVKFLIKPEFWQMTTTLARTIYELNMDRVEINISKPQLILLHHLINSFCELSPLDVSLFESNLLADIYNSSYSIVDIVLDRINGTTSIIGNTLCSIGSLAAVKGYSYIPKQIENSSIAEAQKHKSIILFDEKDNDLIQFTLQIPMDLTNILYPPILIISLNQIHLNLDPLLCEFLNYELKFHRSGDELMHPTELTQPMKSPRKSVTSMTGGKPVTLVKNKKTSNPPESVHSSSEPTVTVTVMNKPKPVDKVTKPINYFELLNLAKSLVLQIDLKQCTIYAPDRSLKLNQPNSNFENILKLTPTVNYVVFRLPAITIKSSHERNHSIDFERKFPIQFSDQIWSSEKDGFPWNFSLVDFSCHTVQAGEDFNFISPNRTKVTLAVTSRNAKDATPSVYDFSFVIHIDTAPIELSLSENQLRFLRSSIHSLISLVSMITYKLPATQLQPPQQRLEISERNSSPNYQSELKEFFGTVNTISENSSESTIQDSQDSNDHLKISIWVQWTLTKFTAKLFGHNSNEETKFIIELEDIITSIDEQQIYSKIKTKVGSMSGVCKTKTAGNNEWVKNDMLGLITRSDGLNDNLEDTFLELTITKALTTNVHNKWGAKRKKNNNLIDTITEFTINVHSIDIKLGLEMLATFLPIFNVFDEAVQGVERGLKVETQRILSVSDLPLVFFQSKGIRIFVPMLSNTMQCNVLIFKITKISITPTAENPLYRKPVRGDIYTKAAQLRILNIPGSKIEDRQYEILFNNISLGSGKWEEILRYLDPNPDTDAYNVNPAFDWNNLTKRPSIEVKTIFNRFNLSLTYAPCIIFENVLVCGQFLEINCVNDLILELSTHEVLLLNTLFVDLVKSMNSSNKQPKKLRTKSSTSNKIADLKSRLESTEFKAKNHLCENQQTDSGFESFDLNSLSKSKKHRSAKQIENQNKSESKTMPFDISFVGGIFSFKLFHLENSEISTDMTDSDEENIVRRPLLSLTLFQPNFLISQSVIEKTTQLSLFDLNLKFGSETSMSKDSLSNFDDVIFETRTGNLDSFGIQPPLARYKEYIRPSGEKHLEFHVKRPICLRFCSKTMEKALAIKTVLNQFTLEYPDAMNTVPMTTSNKIKIIKNYLYGASRFECSIAQTDIVCIYPKLYNLNLSFSKIEQKIDISDHPQKITFNANVDSFTINTGQYVLLNPLTIVAAGSMTQEIWKKVPLISFNISSNCVDLNIGPENILNVVRAKNAFLSCMEKFESEQKLFNTVFDGNDERFLNVEELQHIPTPKCSRTSIESMEEYYQDDLRAGAFQFIDSFIEDSLPLPYQIQIISRDGGIICWRYPQPRALHYVQMFPVPFDMTESTNALNSASPTQNKTIKCHLEYYSNVHNSFLPYSEFFLSEKAIQELELPQRKVTAEIWRIVVMQTYVSVDSNYFQEDSSSEDDDDESLLNTLSGPSSRTSGQTKSINDYLGTATNSANLLNLHPRALVGCMRIDSYFSLKLVPSIELALNISHLTIALKNDLNQQDSSIKPMPDALKQYAVNSNAKDMQTFLKLYVRNLKSYVSIYEDETVTVEMDMMLSSTILEHSYLTIQPLLDEFCLKFLIEHSSSTINLNIVADVVRLRYGLSVAHTLTIAEQLWRQALTCEINETILVTRYVICNCTTLPMKFGQYNTEEVIYLQPKECNFYAFRSDKHAQKLLFSSDVLTSTWMSSEPVLISQESTQFVRTNANDNNQLFMVKVEKLSPTQKLVIVKGQIEFLSMTQMPFHIQYKVNNSQNSDKLDTTPIPAIDFELQAGACQSVLGKCDDGISQCIRLRLARPDRKGWSGEIPLHKTAKNTPWLVKVPTSANTEFISFWVKVFREDIKGIDDVKYKPQRLLIIIWPLFMLRSMLTNDIDVLDKSSDQLYVLPAKGQPVEMQIAGTHETEHEIMFDMKDRYTNKAILSYRAVDPNKFFAENEKFSEIDGATVLLEKPYEINWPCSREEELRWHRNVTQQDPTMPIFKCLPSRELSSSLMLDVVPWCLFINSIGCTVQLINTTDSNCCLIHSNNIAMPFVISNSFAIAIFIDNQWKSTGLIYINGVSGNNKSKNQSFYVLPEDGTVSIQIFTESGLNNFQLTSLHENGTRIFILSPHFVVCNLSRHPLTAWAFCIWQKEKQRKINMPTGRDHIGILDCVVNPKDSDSIKGVGVTTFFNLSHQKNEIPHNKQFNHFIAICVSNNSLSMPILLNKPFNRISFSIPSDHEYIPLAVSAIEHQGQLYISIQDDQSPTIEFVNRTDLELYLAQAESVDLSKPSAAVKSLNDETFEWFTIVPPNKTIFFTPPSVNASFPEKLDNNIGIIIASVMNHATRITNAKEICWSRPVKIYNSSELFLNLPLYGDIKVLVNSKRKTIKILIDNIDYKMEFNVKDIRTKILNPSTASDFLNPIQNRNNEWCQDFKRSSTTTNYSNVLTQQRHELSHVGSHLYYPSEITFVTKAIKCNVYAKGIFITLYTDNEHENFIKTDVAALYIDDMLFSYDNLTRTMELTLFNFQIDNQLYTAGTYDFPVVLCSQQIYKKSTSLPLPHGIQSFRKVHLTQPPLCNIKILFYDTEQFNTEELLCNLQPLRAYIEDKYINVLLDFLFENVPGNLLYRNDGVVERVHCEDGLVLIPKNILLQTLNLSEPLKLRHIRIEPVSVLLSVHTCMRMYIALDHSPLDFAPFERFDIYTVPMRFGYNLGMHYVSGAIFGAGWVFGSLEILGSPSGLARSVTIGLRDFLSMPVQGFLRGPWGLLVGITQGSASLLRNITAGTVNSVTKLAASVARNLDRLSLDDEHLQRTEALRRSRPQGITDGFAQGLTGLGISILGAVGGLSRHALEAHSSVGVVTGFGRGLVGAVTKPISGAAELVALTGQGMLQTVGFNTMPIPREPTMPKNYTIEPSAAKIVWKFLPPMLATDQILFTALATLETKHDTVCIALTSNLIIFISLDKDELLEMYSIERAVSTVDEDDATLVSIRLILNPDDENDDIQGFQYGRILQYVRDSSDQLPMVTSKTLASPTTTSNASSPPVVASVLKSSINKKPEHRISFFMDQHLARHLVNYILMLKWIATKKSKNN